MTTLRLTGALLFMTALTAGCSGGTAIDEGSALESAIVDVPNTRVEQQALGNCWLYASASWVEALNRPRASRALDVSQSYWTYWHIMDRVLDGRSTISPDDLNGTWDRSTSIIRRYGLIDESTFIRADGRSERSARQASALARVNASLAAGGALRSARDRGDRVAMRAAMDDAWELGADQRRWLDSAFGRDGRGTFANGASSAGTPIVRADELPVRYARGPGRLVDGSLANALADWQEVGASGSRSFLTRLQRALHDAQPIYVTWRVDMNALETSGAMRGGFNAATYARNGAGRQGIHMTVMEDYEAVLADGSVLRAGDPATGSELERALDPSARVRFFRVKNSWGSGFSPSVPGMGGYNDLYLDYLTSNVGGRSAFMTVVLPPGF